MDKKAFSQITEANQLFAIDRAIGQLRDALHDHATQFNKHGTLQHMIAVQTALGLENAIHKMIEEAHKN